MVERNKPKRLLLRQLVMRRVLLALLPCAVGAIYYFGWRSLGLIIWAGAVGFVAEYIFARFRGEPVSEAVFVTTTIFALIMPPTVPWHVLTIGIVFAVVMTKQVFGGFGRNFFNPAMAGRCFVYICFPVALTAAWAPAAHGPWGALGRWTTAPTVDATTGATPMTYLKMGKITLVSEDEAVSRVPFDIPEDTAVAVDRAAFWRFLLFGGISGTMGVTSAVLILIGGVYLFYTGTASRTIILTLIVTYTVLTQLLYWAGVEPVSSAVTAVLGRGFLFGAFFMATDPVSAPKTEAGKVLYAMLIGICTVVIANFSIFNGGLMFSILIGNMFGPILDYAVRSRGAPRPREAT